jgi:hypothetical protein
LNSPAKSKGALQSCQAGEEPHNLPIIKPSCMGLVIIGAVRTSAGSRTVMKFERLMDVVQAIFLNKQCPARYL